MVDPGWPDEWLLDISTAPKRRAITRIMDRWIRGCARDGYDAVEFDNLDSWTRSRGLLKPRHAVAQARGAQALAGEQAVGNQGAREAMQTLKQQSSFFKRAFFAGGVHPNEDLGGRQDGG